MSQKILPRSLETRNNEPGTGHPETGTRNPEPTIVSPPAPSSFVLEWLPRVAELAPGRRALDVAMGRGRHTGALLAAGFQVFGVDRSIAALESATARWPDLLAWCADLTVHPLPASRFGLVLVCRYLQRDLFPGLRDAVAPGGLIVYETFTVDQLRQGRGPTSPDHLLNRGELPTFFSAFDLLFYEECAEPEALARLVAMRPR